MKINKFTLLIAAISCLFLAACQQNKETAPSSYDLKHEPWDMASLQRAYPNLTPDTRAYKTALKEAIEQHQSRSTSPSGFDADWTVQGPGSAGARINTIEIDPANDDVIYLGYSGGGIWKSVNNGQNWNPIFDASPFLAIGSIEVDPTNSDIVYAGTGDPTVTGYPYVGNGVYKSTDAGATWTEMGLQGMGTISKVIVDPSNNQIVYAASMGSPFVQNPDRGLYKSINGGTSWTKILYISPHTGIIDIALDPVNTNRIYACGWDRIRSATQSFASGGGGRIFRSTNGGNNWIVMTNGLPTNTQLSRSSLTMSADDPNLIYASIIDSTFRLKGIYKTTNGGDSWATVTDGETNGFINPVSSFGWYLGRIFANPSNDDHVFFCGVRIWNTHNSGSSWSHAAPTSGSDAPHVDMHYMAFDSNGDIYLATDGGLYRKNLGSADWEDIENIPTTQFYRVAYNPHEIDTYYGGAQDNGTQAGNAANIDNWDKLFGADGFQPLFDPVDPNRYFVESQRGNIWVTLNGANLMNATSGIVASDRVHWDMPYIMNSHNPDLMYCGTYRMYKSDSGGNPLWGVISGDLTNGIIPGQPVPTISAIGDAPMDSLAVYCGTTDGNAWRSQDAGANWTNITAGLPNRYITCVKGAPDLDSGVYISHSGYLSDDTSPHLHYSTDYGDTWTDITGDLPNLAVNHIEVMPNNSGNVIFVATDGGVYATLNAGQNWDRLGGNMPYIVTYDLDLNLAKNELIVGTFGRSIQTFPLDSIGVSLTPPTNVDIAGQITTPAGDNVNLVQVELEYGSGQNAETGLQGLYSFEDLPVENTATITPSKNIDADNGVTTFDVLLMKKHILNIDTLDSPYKMIAADINKSKSVSSFDIILLTKIILNLDTVFTGNESWRFVQSDYVFPSDLNPFTPDFPESYTFDPLISNQPGADFIGIKIGDINGNANPVGFNGATDRSFVGELPLTIQDQKFEKGDRVEVAFQSSNFHQMLGYQFTIGFDTRTLNYESVRKNKLKEIGSQDFSERLASQGIITTNWSHTSAVDLTKKDKLFTLSFIANSQGQLREVLQLKPGHTPKEAYQHESDFLDISLRFSPLKTDKNTVEYLDFELYQNTPNPFTSNGTYIEFSLHETQQASIQVTDLNGKLVFSQSNIFPKGKTTFKIPAEIFSSKGVYLYQLATKDQQLTRKMLKL